MLVAARLAAVTLISTTRLFIRVPSDELPGSDDTPAGDASACTALEHVLHFELYRH
jgi:hypothetical protein